MSNIFSKIIDINSAVLLAHSAAVVLVSMGIFSVPELYESFVIEFLYACFLMLYVFHVIAYIRIPSVDRKLKRIRKHL